MTLMVAVAFFVLTNRIFKGTQVRLLNVFKPIEPEKLYMNKTNSANWHGPL